MSRRTPNRPARRFALRAALVLLAIGVTVHAFVVQTVDAQLQRQLAQRGEFIAEYLVAPALAEGTDPDVVADDVVADDPQVSRVTIRDADAAVVGQAGTRDPTDVSQRVQIPGTNGLVAVIDQDDALVQAAATDVTRRLAVVVGAGLLALWLAIVPLAYRLGRELRAQADELREQSRELQRLLDQEHLTVERLRQVDQMRDRFLESISHELRTPLTVVKGSLQMLAEKGDDIPAPMRNQLAERAYVKAQRLNALVQALLDLNATADADERRWVDLRRAVEAAGRALPDQQVELDLDVEGIMTDPTQLVRCLGALLGNTVRHAPGTAPVVVRARRDGDDVELQVDDRGPGIPEDLREEVFQPFRQGELLDAHSPGTGIGLALVAAFAAQHDGRAWASAREGGGTRMHVLLPDVVGEPPADGQAGGDAALDDIAETVVTPVVTSPAAGDSAAPQGASTPQGVAAPTQATGATPPASGTAGRDATEPGSDTAPRRVVRRRVVRRRADDVEGPAPTGASDPG